MKTHTLIKIACLISLAIAVARLQAGGEDPQTDPLKTFLEEAKKQQESKTETDAKSTRAQEIRKAILEKRKEKAWIAGKSLVLAVIAWAIYLSADRIFDIFKAWTTNPLEDKNFADDHEKVKELKKAEQKKTIAGSLYYSLAIAAFSYCGFRVGAQIREHFKNLAKLRAEEKKRIEDEDDNFERKPPTSGAQ